MNGNVIDSAPPGTNLLARIRERIDGMTRSERRIVEHLAQHPLDAAFLPAGQLSELVGVSESSILRFARGLGYANYPALQKVVQDEIRQGLTRNTTERLQLATERAASGAEQLAAALRTDLRNLTATQRQLDPGAFEAAVELLASSRRVYVVGMRGAAPLAHQLGYALNLLREGVVHMAQRADLVGDLMADVAPTDVLVGFAFSRQSAHTIAAVDLALAAGAAVVAITDDPISPIARRATHSLVVATESEAFIQSYTAPTAVTHALLAAVGAALKEPALQRLSRIEEGLSLSQVFYQED